MRMDAEPIEIEVVQPADWPRPRGYANALRVPAGRDLLFMAGQVGWDSQGRLVGPDFVSQFGQALRNCVTLVEAAGGHVGDIVRFTMFCTDKQAYLTNTPSIGAVYREVMGHHYPTMSLVEVKGLIEDGACIEIEATAALSAGKAGA
jgi:enamine deaminase RidA (YjgF/YER057c/UK114 family)